MIILAYDHGAYKMFQKIKKYLSAQGIEYKEFASKEYDALDNFSLQRVLIPKYSRGILVYMVVGLGLAWVWQAIVKKALEGHFV